MKRRLTLESLENRHLLSGVACFAAESSVDLPVAEQAINESDSYLVGSQAVDFLVPRMHCSQLKPFEVTGGGAVAALPVDGPQPWTAAGTATYLGKYTAAGQVQIDAFTSETTADFSSVGPAVFTAANGDEIHFEFAGEITIGEDGTTVWIATFVPIAGSGTGRFERVSGGSFVMTANGEAVGEDGAVPFRWNGVGELEFAKRNDRGGDHGGTHHSRHFVQPNDARRIHNADDRTRKPDRGKH